MSVAQSSAQHISHMTHPDKRFLDRAGPGPDGNLPLAFERVE